MTAMQVEEFALPEIDDHPECESERQAIISRMALAGQIAIKPKFRWPPITHEQEIVYRAICPIETPLDQYSLDPIPLRVLSVAEQAAPHFDKLVVWHPSTGARTDPVLIGLKSVDRRFVRYPLARWGEVLDEWPALVKKAARLIRASIKVEAESRRRDLEASITTANELDDASLISRYRGFTFSPF